MAGTITATQTGNTTGAGFLQVFVLTAAAVAATPATGTNYPTAGNPYSVTVTTTAAGSRVFGAICEGNITVAPTALANSTIYSSLTDSGDTNQYSSFLTNTATGTPGATTVGSSTGAGSSGSGVAGMEVLASGGTLAVDASTPAAVLNATNAQTTASFSPPDGAVLLAVVVTNGTTSVGGPTITITGTGTLSGLTWNLGVNANGVVAGFYQATGVWYATLPGGAAASGPPLAPQFMGGMVPATIVTGAGWRNAQHSL